MVIPQCLCTPHAFLVSNHAFNMGLIGLTRDKQGFESCCKQLQQRTLSKTDEIEIAGQGRRRHGIRSKRSPAFPDT